MADNLFDPPSEDELKEASQPDLFAPPSKDELHQDEGVDWEAASQGFGNGLSMGYLPHLQAASAPLIDRTLEAIADTDIGSKMMGVPKGSKAETKSYLEERDAAIKKLDELQKRSPKSYIGGMLGGSLTSGVATAPLLPEIGAASAMGRVGQAAKTGAILGGIANPGDKEGQIAPFQLSDRLENAGIGAATGAGTQGLGEFGSFITKKAGDYYGKLAAEKAVKAAGAMKRDMNALGPEGVQSLGKSLLDEGAVTPLSRPKDILKTVQGKIREYADDVSNQIKNADEALGSEVNMENSTPEQIKSYLKGQIKTSDIQQNLKQSLLKDFAGVPPEELAPALNKVDLWFKDRPEYMSVGELQQLKTSLNNFLRKTDFTKEMPGMAKEGLLSVRRGAKKAIEDKVDAVAGMLGEAGGKLKATNRKLGSMLGAEDLATDAIARDASNRAFGLTDTMMGIGGAGVGAASSDDPMSGALMGSAAAIANKAGRAYGNPLMAAGFNKLSKTLLSSPAFAKLAAQNQPAFQALARSLFNRPQFEKAEPREPEIDQDPRLLQLLSDKPEILEKIQNPRLKDALRKKVNSSPESSIDAQRSFIEGN